MSRYATGFIVPVVAPLAGMPTGGFGIQVSSLNTNWIVAERMVYGGPNWEIGHASAGVRTSAGTGTTWRFAEGTSAGVFETYFSPDQSRGAPATTTLTYRNAVGAVIGTDALVIPAYGRGTVWANGSTGGQDFTTEVVSTRAITAERAMYWPSGSSAGAAVGAVLATEGGAGEPAEAVSAPGPAPYTLTVGVPGPVILSASPAPAAVVGRPAPSSRSGVETPSSSSGPAWYGSHLAVGKRP